MICSFVYRIFIPVLPFRLRENLQCSLAGFSGDRSLGKGQAEKKISGVSLLLFVEMNPLMRIANPDKEFRSNSVAAPGTDGFSFRQLNVNLLFCFS
jgi:hypothetical protein